VITAYRSGCFAYLHGHSVGGTNPTLVEALGAGCVTVCHDNAFNRETTCGAGRFFKDAGALAASLEELESLPVRSVEAEREISLSIAARQYDWKEIGRQYELVLTKTLAV
jgi:glycosyltransferase involved in cell wall biosynthesis